MTNKEIGICNRLLKVPCPYVEAKDKQIEKLKQQIKLLQKSCQRHMKLKGETK